MLESKLMGLNLNSFYLFGFYNSSNKLFKMRISTLTGDAEEFP